VRVTSRRVCLHGLGGISFDELLLLLSARLQKDLDALSCGLRTEHAAKATTETPPSDLLGSMPGALPASEPAMASSLSAPPSTHSERSRGLRRSSSLSSEREDSHRLAELSTGQSQLPAPLNVRHVFLRGCDASLPARILPALMVICLPACLSLRSQLFVFQA
jgi:hypothetical protein